MNETVEPLLQEPLWETVLKFIPRALLEGDPYETALALVLCGMGIFLVTVLLFQVIEHLKRSVPWYARQPTGWPSWKRHRVIIGGEGQPRGFVWRYPDLECELLKLDFREALQDVDNPRKYLLRTGTMVEFVRREKKPSGAGAKAGKKEA